MNRQLKKQEKYLEGKKFRVGGESNKLNNNKTIKIRNGLGYEQAFFKR